MNRPNPETILLNANNHLCQTWQPYSGTIEHQNLCEACDILRDARKRVIAEAMDAKSSQATLATAYEALKMADKLITVARNHFPKSLHNSDKFLLENTCATIGKALNAIETHEYETINGQRIQCFVDETDTTSWDKWTVVYIDQAEFIPNTFACVGLSGHGAAKLGAHLGKRVPFASIPEQLQGAVLADLIPEVR